MTKKTIEQFVAEQKQEFNTKYELAEIKSYLPNLYKKIMSLYETDGKRSIALFSSIIAISSILGDYSIFYKNEYCHANLFGFVVGTAGSGKSVMRVTEKILLEIENDKEKLHKEEQKLYQSKNNEDALQLKKIKRKTLYIPATNSASNLLKNLTENDGYGLMYETESETVSKALDSRNLGFRDMMRKIFDNQRMSQSYATDHSLEKFNRPKLSVLVSGTPGQFLKLFKSPEDGLLSRFLIFKVRSSKKFSLETKSMEASNTISKNVSNILLDLHSELNNSDSVYFSYSTQQRKECEQIFQEIIDSLCDVYDETLKGVMFRYGLIFWKVAMQISLVETYEESNRLPQVIECTENAFKFTQHFILEHIQSFIESYEKYFQKKDRVESSTGALDKVKEKLERNEWVLALKEQGHSIRRIQELTGIRSTQTIHKIING